MKTIALHSLLLSLLVSLPVFSQDNEVVCPTILPTNPNNSSNSAEIVFYDYDMNILATCTCNHAGQGDGTDGRYNCGTCMPASWSFAQIDSDNPCVNPSTLPVSISDFAGIKRNGYNEIYWITLSERNNDFFILETTTDGMHFRTIQRITGNGNSSEKQIYTARDFQPEAGINYYRLTQVDFDGKSETFPLIALDNSPHSANLLRTVNLQGQEVDLNYSGLVIDQFEDGTSAKRMQP
jgi:hypothetical protein